MILVLNVGSSSVKYRLFDGTAAIAHGQVERIGEPDSDVADHAAAVRHVADEVQRTGPDVSAVGHRVVHGGSRFTEPTLIDDEVLAGIRELIPLAPLHNAPGVAGIEAARALWPGVPHVAVFDTAFHATIPAAATTYAIDADLAAAHGIRRYGFHGTSHRYVAGRTAALLGRPITDLNLIVLHLGNGASACAVAAGRSVETSMGLTPLEGLVMGTRAGDLDPGVVFHLLRSTGLSPDAIEDSLQHHSGLAGLTGSNDMRTVIARGRVRRRERPPGPRCVLPPHPQVCRRLPRCARTPRRDCLHRRSGRKQSTGPGEGARRLGAVGHLRRSQSQRRF